MNIVINEKIQEQIFKSNHTDYLLKDLIAIIIKESIPDVVRYF